MSLFNLLEVARHGLLHARPSIAVVDVLLATHATVIAASLFLHRNQTHRCLELHPAVQHVLRFWLWLTTGMVTAVFVAVHRRHHARCDTPDDPHSPAIHGMRRVMLQGSELYRAAAADPTTLRDYGGGTPDDWIERHVYARHPNTGIALLLVLDLVLFGVVGLTIWAVQMLWMPVFAAGLLNSVGHGWGWRNADASDTSHNFLPLGVLIGGEELHNNHHAFPGSAKFSMRWFEFDIGWLYIRLLSLVGLARAHAGDRARTGQSSCTATGRSQLLGLHGPAPEPDAVTGGDRHGQR